jgi:hypothetical protein
MDRSPDGDPAQQSDLPIYRIDRALEAFNRRIDDLWGPRGLEGEFQFVQRAWRSSTEIESATDQSDSNTNQFGSIDELQSESPSDFLGRCEASSAYFLFTYFARRRGERVQSRPLKEETATLLREWIRESLKRDGIWDVFLNQVGWQSDIALNARREVRRRVRDGREIYHDLLQLFARLPILGYIPQIVHRSWWLYRKHKKELDSCSVTVPEVAFETTTVGGGPLPNLSVKLHLPSGSEDVVQFGEEVLPKEARDEWNDDGSIFQPDPDPEVLFDEKFDERSQEAKEAREKAQKIRLLYSFVLDRIYRGNEEEIGELLDDLTEIDDAVQVAELLEERALKGRELKGISFLWLPLMAQYSDKCGYGTLLGWLFTRLPSETNPLDIYSGDRSDGQGQGIRLALEQLSSRIKETYTLEAERQDLGRDEKPHRALADRVHFLGDYTVKWREDMQEEDGLQIDLSRSDLDIRLTSTVHSGTSGATYSVKFGPDVVPPPEKKTSYQRRLEEDFRSLHQSLQRIQQAKKSGEMRLQSAMSATFSHSYMKTASTLKREINKGLPEEGAVFTKTDLLNVISIRRVRNIVESERPRKAIEDLMRQAYIKSGSKRDFSKIRRMFKYLYSRLNYFNNFLTSNISTLASEPGQNAFSSTIREELKEIFKTVIETANEQVIFEGLDIEFANDKEFRLKKPSFRPERKVKNEENLISLFSNILREGIWRELLMNASEAFATGDPDPSDAEIVFRCEPDQLAIENWADNTVDGAEWSEAEIRKPHGERGFGLYGVKVTAVDILQIAESVRYFERSSRSRVEISVRPGWIVSDT